ncbi:MAG: UbiA-like polyprenyltransferase [Armatimonadota bacterium]
MGVVRAVEKAGSLLRLVKFEHTVFALPFALIATFVCARGLPGPRQLLFIVLACVSARTTAMAFNRIVDRELDARNIRTRERELPTGKVALWEAQVLAIVSAAVFVLCALALNELCFWLSFPALAVLLGYSYTKRFTAWSHSILGLALAIAPVGAWLAIAGRFDVPPLVLSAGVILWVAGFDIIYATLDLDFDRREGLRSAVRGLGVTKALRLAAVLHVGFVVAVLLFGLLADLGAAYFVGGAAAGVLIIVEHAIVRPDDPGRINAAFFLVNGVISVGLLGATAMDIWVV